MRHVRINHRKPDRRTERSGKLCAFLSFNVFLSSNVFKRSPYLKSSNRYGIFCRRRDYSGLDIWCNFMTKWRENWPYGITDGDRHQHLGQRAQASLTKSRCDHAREKQSAASRLSSPRGSLLVTIRSATARNYEDGDVRI
jgi:hypothetical protein